MGRMLLGRTMWTNLAAGTVLVAVTVSIHGVGLLGLS